MAKCINPHQITPLKSAVCVCLHCLQKSICPKYLGSTGLLI